MPIISFVAVTVIACLLIAFALHVGLEVRWLIAFVPLYLVVAVFAVAIALFLKSGVGPQ
jgi:hypothetical protein